MRKRSNKFMKRLLVAACVLWMAMMRVLLVSHENETAAKPSAETVRLEAAAGPQTE